MRAVLCLLHCQGLRILEVVRIPSNAKQKCMHQVVGAATQRRTDIVIVRRSYTGWQAPGSVWAAYASLRGTCTLCVRFVLFCITRAVKQVNAWDCVLVNSLRGVYAQDRYSRVAHAFIICTAPQHDFLTTLR